MRDAFQSCEGCVVGHQLPDVAEVAREQVSTCGCSVYYGNLGFSVAGKKIRGLVLRG